MIIRMHLRDYSDVLHDYSDVLHENFGCFTFIFGCFTRFVPENRLIYMVFPFFGYSHDFSDVLHVFLNFRMFYTFFRMVYTVLVSSIVSS